MRICSLGLLATLVQSVTYSQALASPDTDGNYWPKDSNTLCNIDGETGIRTCYPRIFNATTKFQAIMPGQEIPRGLHVQVDMGTGQRQARLMAADDNVDEQGLASRLAGSDIIKMANAEDRSGQVLVESNIPGSSNTQKQMGFVINAGEGLVDHTTTAQLDRELEELKELAYDTQQAERLMQEPGAVSALLRLSDPSHTPISWPTYTRQLSSVVLGTLVQNNPALQGIAYRAGAIYSLLHILRHEHDAKTAGKHIFALSALTRGYAPALEQFVDLDGFRLLRDLDPHTSTAYIGSKVESARLDLRIIRFIEDLLNPEFNPNVNQNAASKISQFAASWCSTLARRLIDNSGRTNDEHEGSVAYGRSVPYLDSLQLLKLVRRDACQLPSDFEAWAQAELSRINGLKDDGNENYRQALIDLDARALAANV
ncbi:nucleotide exchange factor sil1 [Coemansia guatemalensis]|uniref:Nucleotide exchange factor sil1 n=1 Tax=Coemansia guatemalensis TaxID=2761395 RepID=A0A9W8HS07_9FUNG|nr:nucleotide exchange factor sil1 [Coemansia guatemalensis]